MFERVTAMGVVRTLLTAVVLAVLAAHPAVAQQATQAADAVARQADAAAGWVAYGRADAAGWLGQRAASAASSVAQQAADAAGTLSAQSSSGADAAVPRTPAPLAPNPEFAHFPRYGGMLGTRRIVLRLANKSDDPSGVHGEYQFADTNAVVLVAGDREGDVLQIEESNDGTAITGNWVGRFSADGSLAGARMNVDDSESQPFDLYPLPALSPTPSP